MMASLPESRSRAISALGVLTTSLVAALLAFASSGTALAAPLDRSFANEGRRILNLYGEEDRARAVSAQGQRVLVAGQAKTPSGPSVMAVARLQKDGSTDRSFGSRGRILFDRCDASGGGGAFALSRAPSGKSLVAGSCSTEFGIARVTQRGEPDRSFGSQGLQKVDVFGRARVLDIAVQDDGRIVVVGFTETNDDGDALVLARLRPSGALDKSFGEEGTVLTRFGEPVSVRGTAVGIQSTGQIVVSGRVAGSWVVARFDEDGSVDSDFGVDGVEYRGPVSAGAPNDLALLGDDRIVASGTAFTAEGRSFAVVRYMPDGQSDTSFGGDGAALANPGTGGLDDDGSGLALGPQGAVTVVGTADGNSGGPPPRFAAARFTRGGELDGRFGTDGLARFSMRPDFPRAHTDYGLAGAIDSHARVLIGGISGIGAGDDMAVARLAR